MHKTNAVSSLNQGLLSTLTHFRQQKRPCCSASMIIVHDYG